MRRRQLLKTVPVGAGITFAGCMEDEDDEPEQTDPPEDQEPTDTPEDQDQDQIQFRGDTVEVWVSNAPGGTQDQYGRVWSNNLERYYPDHISTTLAHHVGADGLLQANRFSDADDPDNVLATFRHNTMIANSYADQARFDLSDFRAINWMYPSTRGIQVNPRTTDIEDHWQWDWDTFVERAPDMTFAGTGPHQLIFSNALEAFEPRFDEGDVEVVLFEGGSDARAAIQRGDIDGYMGGYSSNRAEARTDFYKTQFAIADNTYSELVEQIREIDPDAQITGETSMPDEGAQNLTDVVYDPTGLFVRDDVSDDAYEVHLEAVEAAGQDEQLQQQVEDMMGTLTLNHSTIAGEEAEQAFQNKLDLLEEYPEIIPDL